MPLIDNDKLQQAFDHDRIYALQLEVGDVCGQDCTYCYMNALPDEKNSLTDEQIIRILDDCRKLGVTAIEWLGGEPLLRESIFDLMSYSSDLELRNNVWTGGLPFADDDICWRTAKAAENGLISVHIPTVNHALYKTLHPNRPETDLDLLLDGLRSLIDMRYSPAQMLNSVTFTGLQTPEDMIHTIDFFEEEFCIKTSLNVYHTYLRPGTPPGDLAKFIPSDDAVKRVYSRISEQWEVDEYPMNCVNKQYCSATAAILSDGSVTPCATVRDSRLSIHRDGTFYDVVKANRDYLVFKSFKSDDNLPESCKTCDLHSICWGCRSRAYAAGVGLDGKDPRCWRG